MGDVGEENSVLLARRLQFRKYTGVPRLLGGSAADPVVRQNRAAQGHPGPQHQAEYLPQVHVRGEGAQNQQVVEQLQPIQGLDGVQDPLLVEHEEGQYQDAGNGGDVEEAGRVDAEEEKLHQHQRRAQILIEQVRTCPGDVQKPYAQAPRRHQRDHPDLPGHDQGDQHQHPAEARGDERQQQVVACPLLCPHCSSSSWATRRISSWGSKGFFR